MNNLKSSYCQYLSKWTTEYHLTFIYQEKSNTLYIQSNIGFWKIFQRQNQKYALLHLNHYTKEKSLDDCIYGRYHKQKDVQSFSSVYSAIEYIYAHDRAKSLLQQNNNNYNCLPNDTKKQKRYRKQAMKKQQKQNIRQVERLFRKIESDKKTIKMEI